MRLKRTAGGPLAFSPEDFWTQNNPLLRRLLCSLYWWIGQCFGSFHCLVCGVKLTAGILDLGQLLTETSFIIIK